jgi:outer membrane protein TolC
MNSERRIMNAEFYKSILNYLESGVIVVLIFLSMPLKAQSIDSLIAEALENNSQLKSLQYKIKSAEYGSEAADNLPAPSFGIEFSQIPINKTNIWDDAVSQNFSISQMFPLGGKLSAMTEMKKKNIFVQKNSFEDYKTKLIAEIKMSYYSLWLIERKIEVQNQNINLLNGLLKSMETLYAVNKTTQADLLMLKGEIASNESALIVLNNNRDAEIYKLNKFLGRNINSKNIVVSKIIEHKQNLDIKQLEDILVDKNPSIKKMQSMIEMSKAETVANEKEMIPDLMIQGMIMRMPQGMLLTSKSFSQMMPEAKTEWMYGLMASITLPFAPWSSKSIMSKTDELNAQTNALVSEKEEMTREMISELQQAIVKLKNANELNEIYPGKIIPLYKNTVDAQISAYQNNLTNINSVLESTRMLLMQEMNHFMAQADYQMALANIEMMIGQQLKNF